jgi:hypothetical protein
MLNASQRVSINDPTVADGAPTLGTVLAMAHQGVLAALQAVDADEVEDDTLPAAGADDVTSLVQSSDEAGPRRYLAALMIAAALLLAWAGLRSL